MALQDFSRLPLIRAAVAMALLTCLAACANVSQPGDAPPANAHPRGAYIGGAAGF